jgi:uncharacterized lipoprotein YmbA
MNRSNYRELFVLVCGLSLLGGGCLFKSARVSERQFILTTLSPSGNAPAVTSQSPAIDVGFVKMPSYLLRESMVIRKNGSEFAVLENAIWAERLDEGFRRVLEHDLSSLQASDQGHLSATGRNKARVRLSVSVEQFDVDTQGRGTLLASWRFSGAGAARPMKTGEAHLTRSGQAPRGNPQAVATTLSALIGEFSRQIAAVPRDATEPKQ